MSAIAEQLRILVENVILSIGYLGIALLMLLENLFPPIPSELVVPFAGFLVGQGELSLAGVLIATTLGALLGALALYALGYWLGEARLRLFINRYGRWFLLGTEDLDRSLIIFRKYGRGIVLLARLMPIVRSLISIPAGIARMPLGPFLIYSTIGMLFWNTVLTVAGLFLGQNWTRVLGFMDRYELLIWLLLIAALIWFLYTRLGRRDGKQKIGDR